MISKALCVIVMLVIASCSTPRFDKSRVAYPLHYTGRSLTQSEIDGIVRSIQRVEAINHRVLAIRVESTAEVMVETGRGPEHLARDFIEFRKRQGAWTIARKEGGRVIINQ